MAKKPNNGNKHGWKIYFDADTERHLEKTAEKEKFRSGQDYMHELVRRDKLKQEKKKQRKR